MPLNPKWYFRTRTIVIGYLIIGPFILPLAWFNPHYTFKKKIIITLAMVVLTWLLYQGLALLLKSIQNDYNLLPKELF